MSIFIAPFGERKVVVSSFRICFQKVTTIEVVLLLSFRIFGAAMFAEPAIAHIEEVVRLMHLGRVADLN